MQRLHRADIARRQLQTAVELFLQGLDRSSVITLAGAASNILEGLVRRSGKEPFVDDARRLYSQVKGTTPSRSSYAHFIDVKNGVIAHKHLSLNDVETVQLDLEKQAADTLCRAISDFVTLYGQDEPFVINYFQWAWLEWDGSEIMEAFKSVPQKSRIRRPKK